MEIDPKAACWSCEAVIDGSDRYCRMCGRGQGAFLSWYYQPWGLAFMCLFALGPFVIPMIWRSPKLGRTGKWAGTALALAFTVYLFQRVVEFMHALQTSMGGAPGIG